MAQPSVTRRRDVPAGARGALSEQVPQFNAPPVAQYAINREGDYTLPVSAYQQQGGAYVRPDRVAHPNFRTEDILPSDLLGPDDSVPDELQPNADYTTEYPMFEDIEEQPRMPGVEAAAQGYMPGAPREQFEAAQNASAMIRANIRQAQERAAQIAASRAQAEQSTDDLLRLGGLIGALTRQTALRQ